jgi:hypothetical protein
MTESPAALGRLLPADRFHAGVRVATLVLWLVAIVVAYVVLGLIATPIFGPLSGLGILLLVVVAVVVAQPLAWLGERQLLAYWPSGRAAQLEPAALVWRDQGPPCRLDLGQKVNYWRWRFAVRRRRSGRVPGNHHCFAIRLVQGDTLVTLYTFLPPATADALAARYPFYELRRPSEPSKTALGGRDSIYLAAEHARWDAGAELEPGDFEALLAHLAAHLPEFDRSAQSGI